MKLIETAAKEATKWTIEDVCNFVADLGFPENKTAFQDQAMKNLLKNSLFSWFCFFSLGNRWWFFALIA